LRYRYGTSPTGSFTLVTANTHYFDRITGLNLEYYVVVDDRADRTDVLVPVLVYSS